VRSDSLTAVSWACSIDGRIRKAAAVINYCKIVWGAYFGGDVLKMTIELPRIIFVCPFVTLNLFVLSYIYSFT
jgi:hypothetical protein